MLTLGCDCLLQGKLHCPVALGLWVLRFNPYLGSGFTSGLASTLALPLMVTAYHFVFPFPFCFMEIFSFLHGNYSFMLSTTLIYLLLKYGME